MSFGCYVLSSLCVDSISSSVILYVYVLYFEQGYILTSEIDGTIQMKSYLTGNPEIRLALNDDLSIGRGGGSVYGTFLLYIIHAIFVLSLLSAT